MNTVFALLMAATSLLNLANHSPNLPASVIQEAISVANNAIAFAQTEIQDQSGVTNGTTPTETTTPTDQSQPVFGDIGTTTPTCVSTPTLTLSTSTANGWDPHVGVVINAIYTDPCHVGSYDNSIGNLTYKIVAYDSTGKTVYGPTTYTFNDNQDLTEMSDTQLQFQKLYSYSSTHFPIDYTLWIGNTEADISLNNQ